MAVLVQPLVVTLLLLLHSCQCKPRPNILFLVSDDMRPELGCFQGEDFPSPVHPKMHTPNLDALASQSLLLKRAYVQQAVCSPSRTSLLTGRRPDTTHVYDLIHYFRKVGGNYTTIPEYFKMNGYESVGMGKIFHPGPASGHDDPVSWSVPYWHAPNQDVWLEIHNSWIAVKPETEKEMPLPDTQIAEHAIKMMQQLAPAAKSGKQPFFLAVGFHKPHLPFVFPERFLDYYPESDISLPDNEYAPVNMPPVAWSSYMELRTYKDIRMLNGSGAINTTLPNQVVKDLRRAYYSALSYTDELIGQVVSELDRLGLRNNTIISFWGDHGWQLGEHGEWCKQTNFELATHAPMMVSVPGLTDQGVVTEQLTEFVDLFPTLVDAAGLPSMPLCPEKDSTKVKLCREGTSLLPLAVNPTSHWKNASFSQYPRDGNIMGYSIRTTRWRYTEWVVFHHAPEYTPIWDKKKGVELYDHDKDPEENYNRAMDPDYQTYVSQLSSQLHLGWRNALPK